MNLTICFITSRDHPEIGWFLDSLRRQLNGRDWPEIVIVDSLRDQRKFDYTGWPSNLRHVEPKPTVWQGRHRLAKTDWWAKSNSLNTGFALCRTKWVACLDDRCVLMPGWIDATELAISKDYAVCGSYEKRTGMTVQDGQIIHGGIITGRDCRETGGSDILDGVPSWFYGCSFALPTEWVLQINGAEESLDSLGAEDTQFGAMLFNNGLPFKYNQRMRIVEDRTPEFSGPAMRRESKERFPCDPQDKGHKAIERFHCLRQSQNNFSLRELREKVLAGESFPHHNNQPSHDWFDQQPITSM